MIRTLKIAFLILGSVILQMASISRISILGSWPDLGLSLVVSVALYSGSLHGVMVGFVSGLLYDLFSGGPLLGVQSFSRAMVGYGAGLIQDRLYSDNIITQMLSGIAATLAHKIITMVYLTLLFTDTQFLHIRFSGLIPIAIVNSIFVVAIFWLLRKFVKAQT